MHRHTFTGALQDLSLRITSAGTVHAIEQGNAEIDAQEAAVSFNRQFTTRYGDIHPRFLECSWQEAAVQAQNQRRSLFVYLHSRAHEVCLLVGLLWRMLYVCCLSPSGPAEPTHSHSLVLLTIISGLSRLRLDAVCEKAFIFIMVEFGASTPRLHPKRSMPALLSKSLWTVLIVQDAPCSKTEMMCASPVPVCNAGHMAGPDCVTAMVARRMQGTCASPTQLLHHLT